MKLTINQFQELRGVEVTFPAMVGELHSRHHWRLFLFCENPKKAPKFHTNF